MYYIRTIAPGQCIEASLNGVQICHLFRRGDFSTGDFILLPDSEWERLYSEYKELLVGCEGYDPVEFCVFKTVVAAANRLRVAMISVNEEITNCTGFKH